MANGKAMKKIKRFNESVINSQLTNLSQEIIDYLETWPDEYDDFKFNFKEIKTNAAWYQDGLIIQVEYILPEILWRNQDFSVKNINYIESQLSIWNRLKTLFIRLESLGCSEVKYKDATFISQRLRSIQVIVFISSNTP
jgi:hypothetical protein